MVSQTFDAFKYHLHLQQLIFDSYHTETEDLQLLNTVLVLETLASLNLLLAMLEVLRQRCALG
jgi:hypothetical protein